MAAEIGRLAAFATSRSTTLVRQTIARPQSRFLPATRFPSTPARPFTATALRSSGTTGWAKPARETQTRTAEPADITKPNMASYENVTADPDMLDFADDIELSLDDLKKTSLEQAPPQPLTHDLHCVPRLGRTVNLNKNTDVGRAFKLLNAQVMQNRVRRMVGLQKEHERPGLKRKRLNSERWRKRFKTGFKATVKRVNQLVRQGW